MLRSRVDVVHFAPTHICSECFTEFTEPNKTYKGFFRCYDCIRSLKRGSEDMPGSEDDLDSDYDKKYGYSDEENDLDFLPEATLRVDLQQQHSESAPGRESTWRVAHESESTCSVAPGRESQTMYSNVTEFDFTSAPGRESSFANDIFDKKLTTQQTIAIIQFITNIKQMDISSLLNDLARKPMTINEIIYKTRGQNIVHENIEAVRKILENTSI